MSNYRYLIFNTIIGSIFVSAAIICQPPQPAQEAAHVYTGSRPSLPQPEEQPAQHPYVGRKDAKTPAKVVTVAQPTDQPVRPYTENRSAPPQPAVKVARSSPTPSTPNQHAYKPSRQQNNRTIVAGPQPAVQITPPQSKRPQQIHAYDNRLPVAVNVVPTRQRPIIVQRPLPQTIVINQRSAVCPFATLVPVAVAKKGNFVELNDGSIWKVRHRDRNKVKKWTSNDAIVIETGNFFSWHSYSLVNYSRGESIDVELHISDNWNGSASHWITEVNPIQGYVRLENGSIWRMSTSELASWSQNDDVIVGLSKDWFSNRYNYVLINPRAKSRFTATLEF